MKHLLLVGFFLGSVFLVSCGKQSADSPRDNGGISLRAMASGSVPTIRKGSQNRAVVALQFLLRARGQTVVTDGLFGSGTENAVKNFQKEKGMEADGVVGPATWGKLAALLGRGKTSSGQPIYNPPNMVRAVQYLLKLKPGAGNEGIFGATTEQYVKDFQKRNGLTADGLVGGYTWAALIAEAAGGSAGAPSGTTAQLAQRVLNDKRIDMINYHVSGVSEPQSTALANMKQAAAGQPIRTSYYGHAGGAAVNLSPNVLKAVIEIANLGSGTFSTVINSIAGSRHSYIGSDHYAGRAVDLGVIGGNQVSSANRKLWTAEGICKKYGADQVFGPHKGSAGHDFHFHCGWPR
jgi:zinc D-Ala-D-Ala carboxypeptidase